jgi:hypothetical protein
MNIMHKQYIYIYKKLAYYVHREPLYNNNVTIT